MVLQRDALGQVRYPARVVRSFKEQTLPGASVTAPVSLWTVASGTYSMPTTLSGSSVGRQQVQSGATAGNAAAIKGIAPFNVIAPGNFWGLKLTLDSVATNVDTGADFQFGFQGSSSTVGGATIMHLNGANTAVIRVYNAAGALTDFPTDYAFFQASGGGRYRRNLSFLLLPQGYVGSPNAVAAILEDDQVAASVDISSAFSAASAVVPIAQAVTRTAAAVQLQWAQSEIVLVHN